MPTLDLLRFSFASLRGHRLRSALSMLGIAIGIAAVILLTSIGEGTRLYVVGQFTQFGTNLLSVTPGKTQTVGIPGVLGGTTRKLTLEDAQSLERLPGVERVHPHTYGQARVEAGARGRSVFVYGVTSDMPEVWKFEVRQGVFLPPGDPRRGAPLAVLGPGLKRELFGDENALGAFVRIGGERFRVIGVLASEGKMLGIDLDDAAYIPLGRHMKLFNRDEVNEVNVLFGAGFDADKVAESVRGALMERHDGNEDFTITTQQAMLDVFGRVMDAVTMAVGGIAAISLLVGAIGILSMMWIAVGERTGEIGLLRALGARAHQVQLLFLFESVMTALVGGVVGLGVGFGLAALLASLFPGLPVHTPPEFALAAVLVSAFTGLASGVMPARRAAGLDPIEALRAE